MIRPRLRPTISRRNKYIGIAPRAESKLAREARRGSHDLRRLVGHANFLDVLVDSLDPFDEAPVASEDGSSKNEWAAVKEAQRRAQELNSEDDDDEDQNKSDESWSDDSDDEDHALVRTASGAAIVGLAKAALEDTKAAIVENGDDYFTQRRHSEPELVVDNLSLEEEIKNAGIVVSVTSPLSDLAEETEDDRSPMSSPGSMTSSCSVRDSASSR